MPLVEVDAHGETRKEEEEENGDKDECGRRIFIVIIVPPFLSNAAIIGLVVPISAVPAFPEAPATANTDCPPARPVVSVPFATLIRICDPANVTLTYVLALGFPEALRSGMPSIETKSSSSQSRFPLRVINSRAFSQWSSDKGKPQP